MFCNQTLLDQRVKLLVIHRFTIGLLLALTFIYDKNSLSKRCKEVK